MFKYIKIIHVYISYSNYTVFIYEICTYKLKMIKVELSAFPKIKVLRCEIQYESRVKIMRTQFKS